MEPRSNELNEQDSISLMEGFDAMRHFLRMMLHRRGRPDDEIEFMIGGLTWSDGAPNDPLMWGDWVAAVRSVQNGQTD
jgi:hypothetical protein